MELNNLLKPLKKIVVLGDSILKGIQPDPETGRYITRNDIDVDGLSREFGLTVENQSHFGSTVLKGDRLLDRLLERGLDCDAVVMDFGGNDCDFKWGEVAAHPEAVHLPAVTPEAFVQRYRAMLRKLRQRDIVPIVTTLPPLEPQRFLDWWCRDLDQEAVLRWVGGVCNIYAHQEGYSHLVERLAWEERAPLVDLRSAFLRQGHLENLICADGTHPNSAGQALITQAFRDFAHRWEEELLSAQA